VVAGIAAVAAVAEPAVRAASPEQTLAERYAPIVALKDQDEPCDRSGEGWRPTAVDPVLGNPRVRLRGAVEQTAPTAADLFGAGVDSYLDLPGAATHPGCTYERDARRLFRGRRSIAYAHVVRERGVPHRLALQYWLYYYFNDFNDKHESDWEGIQLSFAGDSARDALHRRPLETAYAQHEGGELSGWDSTKLERAGTHPLVYVASGSHANHYSSALWLGHSASEGWGCEDTRGPSRRVALRPVLLTSRVAWVAYEGRWGQKGDGPNTGPTGPNTKARWTSPFTWQDALRERSLQVPAAVTLGQSVTGAFCGAVAKASTAFAWFGSPVPMVALLAGLVALLAFAATRTAWRPAPKRPVRSRRSTGQILRASQKLYLRHGRLFLGIGAVSIPLAFAAVGLERLIHWDAVVAALHLPGWPLDFVRFDVAHVLVDVVAINATTAIVLERLDSDRPIGLREAYRLALRRFWPLSGTVAIELAIALVLLFSVVGIPWLVWMAVSWAFNAQEVTIGKASARSSFRSSRQLVRGSWWRTAGILGLLYAVGIASAPLVGFAFLLGTSLSPVLVNLIGSLVYAATLPYIAIATTLLWFDLRTRQAQRAAEPIDSHVRERAAAVVALACAVGAAFFAVEALLGDVAGVVQVFICVLLLALGGWLVLTRRGSARAAGVATVVLAVAGLVILGIEHWQRLLHFVPVAVLLAGFGLAARAALRRTRRTTITSGWRRVPPARRGVLIVNPRSGSGKAERFELVKEARVRGLETVVLEPGTDLRRLAAEACADGADVIGMAGGDGSQALVAEVAMRHDVAFVCIPSGTRNHLALDLGLDRDDVVGALDAFADGLERRIDLATVNGRVFVNNASLGAYAQVVQSDEYRDAKLATWARMLPELLGPSAAQQNLSFVGPDATEHEGADFVLVSNNPYRLMQGVGAGTRPRLDTGRLGIAAGTIRGANDVTRLVSLAAIGRSRTFRGVSQWSRAELVIHSASPVPVGLDGEAVVLEPPLLFLSLPQALRVRLPRRARGLSPAAAAATLSGHDLVALARIAVAAPRAPR
ncbi:MAG TPA: diacylglycerol kinase family protein, partial [Gaiellaceae bacterium]